MGLFNNDEREKKYKELIRILKNSKLEKSCEDYLVKYVNNVKDGVATFTFYDFEPGEYCFDDNTGKKRLLFTGKDSFIVKEIEVFKITR